MPSKGLCQCGCGGTTTIALQSHTAKGYIRGEPRRFLPGHNNGKVSSSRWLVEEKTGCWIWQRARQKYGHYKYEGKVHNAHRSVYLQLRGVIPEGLQLDHLCRNKLCVNPDHMEMVSAAENMRRSSVTKLTKNDVIVIRQERANGTPLLVLAKRFHVTSCTICDVAKRRSWKDV